jgi:hypothetical protein
VAVALAVEVAVARVMGKDQWGKGRGKGGHTRACACGHSGVMKAAVTPAAVAALWWVAVAVVAAVARAME